MATSYDVDIDPEPQGYDGQPSNSSHKESSENIRILVRIRPSLYAAEPTALDADGPQSLSAVSSDGRKSISCSYDYVLSPLCSQGDVYKIVQQCTESVLAGYNSTVFAYGQTGSGKTHTMFGPPGSINQGRANADIGIIPRAINDIFQLSQTPDVNQFSVLCSFVQLYNEHCFDMLRDGSMSTALAIREDVTGEIYVQGLSEYIVKSVSDTLLLLNTAEENRAIRETNMNQYSSRSHSIFQILVEQKKTAEDGGEITLKAKFNLVDLAGSEKWNTKQDMMQELISEMTNINLSLHTLGKCISALVKRSKQGSGSNVHIPYRDSKLTRLLQDSLGGNSKTFLIATVSPAASNVDESINTLKFADRAKQVMIQAKVNESRPIDHAMVQNLQSEVKSLKNLLKEISIYMQSLVSRSSSPTKSVAASSPVGSEVAEGGVFLTHHACSGRVAFDNDVISAETSNITSAQHNMSKNSQKKAALFDAIQAALEGTVPPKRVVEYNIASYAPPERQQAKFDSLKSNRGDDSRESIELGVEMEKLSETVRRQEQQLQALEQREMDTWHLLEAVQDTMKMFFKFEIEEDDMKKQVNKIFTNLKDIRDNKPIYSLESKSSPTETKAPRQLEGLPTGVSLPSIDINANRAGKKNGNKVVQRDGATGQDMVSRIKHSREHANFGGHKIKPTTKSKRNKSHHHASSDIDTDSSEDGAPSTGHGRLKRDVLRGSHENSSVSGNGHGPVAFRVRGAPSAQTNDSQQNWQTFGSPTYTEEEQEAMLLEKIKQKKKKKRKEEKVAEWLRSKEERTMEAVQREVDERNAREESERKKEEKRRAHAEKQKQKLNEYYARVKSDLLSIQQMNELGLSPEDVL